MKIKLSGDNDTELEKSYRDLVEKFIEAKIITLKEWNTKFYKYRDSCGYSIIHYLYCKFNGMGHFITENPLMIKERKKLIKRFGIQIFTLNEFVKFEEKEVKKKEKKTWKTMGG